VSYPVEVLDEVRRLDMPVLLAIDPALGRAVAEIVRDLHFDPWLGAEMRTRVRLDILRDCRKVSFDLPSHKGKPRFRLIYRNRPDDGSIAIVTVLAVHAHRRGRSAGREARRGVRPVRGPDG
jgi:hypothetical protein